MANPSALHEKGYWVWVTSREYFEDEEGHDSSFLDPNADPCVREDSWWTCHLDTKAGD